MTEMTSNPMPSAIEVGGSELDRRTLDLSRCDDEDGRYVRSVPDILLMTADTTAEIQSLATGVIVLQLITSIMVTVSEVQGDYQGYASFVNIVTFITSSAAIATSTNSSFTELWTNNACIELLKKEKKDDATIKQKDSLITLYYIGQCALMIATVVSIAQQSTPVGIITNCTGLLLIQNLDQGIFACWKVEARASHEFKVKLKEVMKNPKFSSKKTFLAGFFTLYIATVVLAAMYTR